MSDYLNHDQVLAHMAGVAPNPQAPEVQGKLAKPDFISSWC